MGAWGYKVGEDDAFRDVYDFYFDTYNQGASPEEASRRTLEAMAGYFSDIDDRYEAHLALAFAQWETQFAVKDIVDEVERFISTGESLKNWSERGGDETLLKRRQGALLAFLRKINKPRRAKKRRVVKVPEFKEVVLVDLTAPDNRKSVRIQQTYADGQFCHTSATVMWADGGGSIFHSYRSDLEIAVEWRGSQSLHMCFQNAVQGDLIFGIGNQEEAFFCGDRVALIYEFSS
jgi:hypothetical protein